MLFLCFPCRSSGANAWYITFFYKHFTPTGLFSKLKCYGISKLLTAGSILQIELDVSNRAIVIELLSAMKNAKCLGSIVDD